SVTRLLPEDGAGRASILHLKALHPLDDHYGLGCVGAAAGAVAIHNAATVWNKALLDNAARPSGAMVYDPGDGSVMSPERVRARTATVRSPFGGGIFGGQTHSQSPEGIFTHVSGVKTVIPSTPYDAKGLLIAAIEDNDPVIFFEPKRIYNGPFDGHYDRPSKSWAGHPG
ncbi:phage portal protein, partial [Flavobacterium chungangensis]